MTSLSFESGFDEAQGRRESMEDTHVVIDDVHENNGGGAASRFDTLGFFGVYDGHGGVDAAQMVQKYLHENIFGCEEWKAGNVEGAISHGFEQTDEHIVKLSNEKGWMNGSTAVIGLVANRKLYTANIGDSEAVLVREKNGELEALALTVPHKASDPKEKERIEKLGGHVFFGRVFGALAVSRSFGDSKFKIPKTTQNFVSWEPSMLQVELNPETDRFLIFACDGLWDVMTHKEAANFVAKHRREGLKANEIAKLLVREALNKKTEDNVTVVIVFLNWNDKKDSHKDSEIDSKTQTSNSGHTNLSTSDVPPTPKQDPEDETPEEAKHDEKHDEKHAEKHEDKHDEKHSDKHDEKHAEKHEDTKHDATKQEHDHAHKQPTQEHTQENNTHHDSTQEHKNTHIDKSEHS